MFNSFSVINYCGRLYTYIIAVVYDSQTRPYSDNFGFRTESCTPYGTAERTTAHFPDARVLKKCRVTHDQHGSRSAAVALIYVRRKPHTKIRVLFTRRTSYPAAFCEHPVFSNCEQKEERAKREEKQNNNQQEDVIGILYVYCTHTHTHT